MSGGSWDYLCFKVEEAASRLQNTPDTKKGWFERRILGDLLELVSEALHDIEWVDSCDYAEGDEAKAISRVFQFMGGDDRAKEKIDKAIEHTRSLLEELEGL